MSLRGLFPLGVAGVGGVALASYLSGWRKRRQLSVVSWNLLATPFTEWEAPYHRNPAGKIEAGEGNIETDRQSYLRYSRAGAFLLSESPDVVLLQECEPAFFSKSRNKYADALLKRYQLFPCFAWEIDGGIDPATAVLLRRDTVKTLDIVPRCVGGSQEVTGGTSKVCAVVDGRVNDEEYTFASGHFTWDGDAAKRENHVKLLEPVLSPRKFVLGGDFNAGPSSLAELRKRTWLQGADLVPLDPCTGTFMNMPRGGVNETVDHLFVSRGLRVVEGSALLEAKCPYGEGSPAEVVGPSDHVPIRVTIDAKS